jgi:hypothetical protein
MMASRQNRFLGFRCCSTYVVPPDRGRFLVQRSSTRHALVQRSSTLIHTQHALVRRSSTQHASACAFWEWMLFREYLLGGGTEVYLVHLEVAVGVRWEQSWGGRSTCF